MLNKDTRNPVLEVPGYKVLVSSCHLFRCAFELIILYQRLRPCIMQANFRKVGNWKSKVESYNFDRGKLEVERLENRIVKIWNIKFLKLRQGYPP